MKYRSILFRKYLGIKKLVTIHYYEFSKDFVFSGERHDFWEFHYVDEGEVEISGGDCNYILRQGDIVFHKPGEFHSVLANKKIAPNSIVVCFECNSSGMKFFEGKRFGLDDNERSILANIMKEAANAYAPLLGNPAQNILNRRKNSTIGCEQLVKAYMELLLISIMRRRNLAGQKSELSSTVKEQCEKDLVKRVKDFMERNIASNLTLTQLCHFFNVGKTHLCEIFKSSMGLSVMEYFRNMKIEYAKTLLREGNNNLTEISMLLGYGSLHYFSRYFKQATGSTPTEYSRSVRIRMGDFK